MSDDFSIFDITYETEESVLPDWAEFEDSKKKDIAKQMYKIICENRDLIIKKLNNGVALKGKEKKIIRAKISTSVGKNTAYLNNREFPNLIAFIDETNDQLARKKPVGATSKPSKSTSALNLKARVGKLESLILRKQLESLVSNQIVGQLGAIKQQNIKLSDENDRLSIALRESRASETTLMIEVSDQLTKIAELEQKLKDLGADPDPEPPLKRIK